MTNRQLAALCGAFLAGSILVAGANVLLVRSAVRVTSSSRRTRIAMIPRWKGSAYFVSCREGAEEAARDLDVELAWDGPNGPDSSAQFQILQTWVDRQVDAIAVAASDPSGISLGLRKARAHGIPIVAWDSDVQPDARDIFVAAVDVDETVRILADEAGRLIGGGGDVAVIADSSPGWREAFQAQLSARRPALAPAAVLPADDDGGLAFRETRSLVSALPSVKLVVALSPFSLGSVAEAVMLSGHKGVDVIGVGPLASCQRYLDGGVAPVLVHWSPQDLGYLTVYVAALLARHQLNAGADSLPAGRLGRRDLCGSEIVLGKPVVTRSSRR